MSTSELLRLRQRVAATAHGSDELESILRGLRDEMLAELAKSDSSVDRVYAIFREVWNALAAAPENHTLHVPPLYLDDALQRLLRHLVTSLHSRELLHVCGSTENVGHAVLGGVEGTGKTTLLRAVTIAVAVLFDRMVPVTHTFTADVPTILPSSLIRDVRAELGQPIDAAAGAFDDAAQWELGRLRAGGHDALLVLDEFQHVFKLPSAEVSASEIALPRRITHCSAN
jgi:hypothetical protein